MMRRGLTALLAFGALTLSACGPSDELKEPISDGSWKLAHPGPWDIPDTTLAVGDTQYVAYTGAGPWLGEQGCSGDITPGGKILRSWLYAHFPQTYSIGGYSCRSINGDPTKMSVHATGRALDVMIHTIDTEADNDLGDPIGNYLIENAEAIGIQYIIWDLWTWEAARPVGAKEKAYGGAHPHNDHLHVELSEEASKNTTNWFDGVVTPPVNENCAPIPEIGAELEETDGCFFAYGPPKYWRQEAKGHAGGLLWTNAFEADDPSNWARWDLDFVAGGKYTVEVWIDPEFGVYDQVRYEVRANAQQTIVVVDQSKANGWVSLGDFEFAPGGDQWLSMYDNVLGPVADDQHITADALRLTPEGGEPPPGWQDNPIEPVPDDTPADPVAGGTTSEGDAGCACRSTGRSSGNAGEFSVLFALALALRRRRRRSAR